LYGRTCFCKKKFISRSSSIHSGMKTAKEIIKTLEKHRTELKKFGVRKIVLFGSFAQGTATTRSDIDFLVEYEQGRGLFDDHVHLSQFLEDLFGRNIDLGEPKSTRGELKQSILEGKKFEALI